MIDEIFHCDSYYDDGGDESYPVDLLVILPYPTQPDLAAGHLLAGEDTDFVLDYLEALEGVSWAVAWVFPEPIKKPKKADYKEQADRLADVVTRSGARVVLAMGSPALEILWPSNKGKVPSINKARTLPITLGPGRELLCTYSPRKHDLWLQTDGRMSMDCTEEFIRAFTMVGQVLTGTYSQPVLIRYDVRTPEAVSQLEQRLLQLNVTELSIDIEDATYISNSGLLPHTWEVDYPDYPMPECLTMWGADNKMLEMSLTFDYVDMSGKRVFETFTLYPEISTWVNLGRLFHGRTLYGWNINYEIMGLWVFRGIWLWDWVKELGVTLVDPYMMLGCVDHSQQGLGLKQNAQEKENFAPWDLKIMAELKAARDRRAKDGGPNVASFADCSLPTRTEYNGWDTLSLHKLVRNYFQNPNRFPGFAEGNIAYDFLMNRALRYFGQLEREGILIDLDHVNAMLDKLEAEIEQLESEILTDPFVTEAARLSEKEYNPRSPIYFQMLVALTHGQVGRKEVIHRPGKADKVIWHHQFPDDLETTETGRLASGAGVMAKLAGDHEETYEPIVPIEEKTPQQLVWHKITRHKKALDYAIKFYTILNYTSSRDSRIHANFRLVRSEVSQEDSLDASEKGGGAISGRTSSSPNVQNTMKDKDIQRCYVAPPGFVIVEIDFSRAELVWLAFNTGDPLMRQWAIEGKDQHAEKGALLWSIATGRPVSEFDSLSDVVKELWRAKGKTQNFADVYMQEPATTAALWGLPVAEVIETAILSEEAHPAILQAKINLYNLLQDNGIVRTSVLGRVRSAPTWVRTDQRAEDFFSFDREQRKKRHRGNLDVFRSMWNTKAAQADSNDMAEWKGVEIFEKLETREWLNPEWVRPHNFVHDSNKYYVKEDYVDIAVPALVAEAKDLSRMPCNGVPGGFDLPIGVSAEVGYNLSYMMTYEKWKEQV